MELFIIDKPTTVDSFMVEYQFGYMYMRYLMWNFVGQNDIQGNTIIKTEIGSAEYRLLLVHLVQDNNLPSGSLNN
jgi:hypothetical protein